MADTGKRRAAINISTATTTTVITTAADEYFNIHKIFLHSSGVQGATLNSGSTVINGKLDTVAQWRVFLESVDDEPLLRGVAAGDDFTIVTTAAVQFSGFVVYKLTT